MINMVTLRDTDKITIFKVRPGGYYPVISYPEFQTGPFNLGTAVTLQYKKPTVSFQYWHPTYYCPPMAREITYDLTKLWCVYWAGKSEYELLAMTDTRERAIWTLNDRYSAGDLNFKI